MSRLLKKYRILVTPQEACRSLGCLPERLLDAIEITPTYGRLSNEKKLISLLKDKDAAVLDLEPIGPEVLKSCPYLKVISRFGEGCDSIDFKSAKKMGVRITKTRGASSLAVARHALTLILSLLHRITENDRNLKAGLWERKCNISENDIKLGIVGFGKIGQSLADLAQKLGFKILLYSRTHGASRYLFVDTLEELINLSDIISIHLPLTPETKHIISKDVIRKLSGKYLVNTARGGLVDEKALLESLENGGLLGYAADVFLNEPVKGVSKKLAGYPKVIASPHIAALDKITAVNMTKRAFENALNCLKNNHSEVISYADR